MLKGWSNSHAKIFHFCIWISSQLMNLGNSPKFYILRVQELEDVPRFVQFAQLRSTARTCSIIWSNKGCHEERWGMQQNLSRKENDWKRKNGMALRFFNWCGRHRALICHLTSASSSLRWKCSAMKRTCWRRFRNMTSWIRRRPLRPWSAPCPKRSKFDVTFGSLSCLNELIKLPLNCSWLNYMGRFSRCSNRV